MSSVLIVGCGVYGLSTAYHLAKSDPKLRITCMDGYPVPSPWSAANDYNKIIRAEYTDMVYVKMSIEAIDEWRSNKIFKKVYKECGRLMITPSEHKGRQEFERVGIANMQKVFDTRKDKDDLKIEYFKGGEQIKQRFPPLSGNTLPPKYESKFNPISGLGHAGNSLKVLYKECKRLGVNFIFGEEKGKALKIIYEDDNEYIVTGDGVKHTADKIVIACGASTGYLINLGTSQSATGLFVTHIKLTPQEYKKYKDIPIVFDSELGYFFPPDEATRIMKIALPGSGTSRYVDDPFKYKENSSTSASGNEDADKISLPRYKNEYPQDTIPVSYYKSAKKLLETYVPDLSYHPLIDNKVCWIGDTSDSHYIIDKVPKTKKLFIASGDSGHAFKLLPNIGKYISAKLNDTLDPELSEIWKWRVNKKFDATDCNWRIATENLDYKDIQWYEEPSKSKL